MIWYQKIATFLRSGKLISMAGGLTGTGVYVSYTDWTRFRRMMTKYASGNILPPMAETTYETVYHQRPELEKTLHRIFDATFSNEYYLISGDVGTGKTRSVVEVIRSMMAKDGRQGLGAPIYVMANQGNSFAETLGAAVGFRFDEHISFQFFLSFIVRINAMPRRDDSNRLTRVLNAIEKSAFSYMQLYGRPAVIVIDSVDWLQKNMPTALDNLLEKAKVWADANIVKVVFVINSSETETHMSKNSGAWSRLATPVIVDDLQRDEALAFLQSPYLREHEELAAGSESDGHVQRPASLRSGKPMDGNLAGRIVDLVGGRILQLIAIKRDWLYGVSFDDSAEELKNREREELLQIWKTDSHWKIMKAIHSAPGHTIPLSSLLQQVSFADVQALANLNVIHYYRDGQHSELVVTFRSKLTLQVFDEIQDYCRLPT